ncbi:MAG: VirB3 family type IV secretion system protein [Rickettsiales bacterium]|jgi:type IV secretory pathway VirB3-like protein|nr:VirB3 family type IV secretion system protein [Rickettsiales bacterium]
METRELRQQVLKALANPSRIFYVPYTLAVLNFVLQFLVFIVIFIGGLIISGGGVGINPLAFLISVMAVHSILAGFSKREPQLAQIIAAKLRLFKSRAPNKLTA